MRVARQPDVLESCLGALDHFEAVHCDEHALPIFQYWFARCAVKMWVRLRKPCRAWYRIVTYFVRVDTFQRGHRCNYDHDAESNSK
jgi:hypothetical protein